MRIILRPADCCSAPVPAPALDPQERDRWISLFRALDDPTRLDIFRLIAAQSAPICVCDIVDRFQVSQPTISHHLRVLRDAGLVTVSRRGVWAYYAPDPAGVNALKRAANELAPAVSVAAY